MAKINILDKAGATFLIGLIKADLTAIRNLLTNKVDKDGNKVLSDNNYTTTERNKLSGIADNAQVNVLEGVKVNNTPIGPIEKVVNIDLSNYAMKSAIPTNNNTLTNGAGYQTASEVESIVTGKGYQTAKQVESTINKKKYQTAQQVETIVTGKGYQTSGQVQSAITTAVNALPKQKRLKLDVLPVSGDEHTLYLIPSKSSSDKNACDEFIWTGTEFEQIGSTAVDLTGYAKTTDFEAIDNTELETLWNTSTGK